MVKVVDGPSCNCRRLEWWAEEDHEWHADQYDWKSAWPQSVQDKPARDAIPHLGDAPDSSRDPASDESKKLG